MAVLFRDRKDSGCSETAVCDTVLHHGNEISAAGKTAYSTTCNLIPDQTWKDDFGASLLLYAQGQKSWDDVVKDAVAEWEVEREITNTANGY